MRTLVTGCAGFIGFHLCETLLHEGHTVVGIDNMRTGQEINVRDLSAMKNFRFVRHDITEPLPTGGDMAEPFQVVYNLACPASPVDFAPGGLEIMDVCSRGVWNLLELCRAQGARLLHTSTSEVYGDPTPDRHPQVETYWGNVNPIGPRACYDEGKRFAEALIVNYVKRYPETTARVVRIFNTYGPRMRLDDGRVLPNFVVQAFKNLPITVHGDGEQTRSFCFVSDMVDGFIRLVHSDVIGPVNIGNPQEITMLEFAREIIHLCGSKSEIRFTERPKDDPNRRCPDITIARSRLGWQPRVDRSEGLARTVSWFREHLGIKRT